MHMNDLVGCRDMELLCRHRAAYDTQHRWKWLGEAERWKNLAQRENTSRFHGEHAGPMAVGPNARGERRTIQDVTQREGRNSPLD
jgi:hypothetical protein